MKNQQLFDKTIAVLVKAYMEGTLYQTNCYACAVGNIIAAGMGYKYKTTENSLSFQRLVWDFVENYDDTSIPNWYPMGDYAQTQLIADQIKSTGYSYFELTDIEHAFEFPKTRQCPGDEMYNGLMSVVDCLMKIHEATEAEAEEAKQLFIKQPILV